MIWVSVTRLRLRAAWLLPVFVPHALRAAGQARRADGYLGGALLLDRKRAFWTMTVWRDAAAMRGYVTADAHRQAMPRLPHWCDEASVAHWEQPGDDLPSWDHACQRMKAHGRPSTVHMPSPDHQDMAFPPPRPILSRSLPPIRQP